MSSTIWRWCNDIDTQGWEDVAGKTYYRLKHELPSSRNILQADGDRFTLVANADAVDATEEWFIDGEYLYLYDNPSTFVEIDLGHEITLPEPNHRDIEEEDWHIATIVTDGGKVVREDPGYKTIYFRWEFRNVKDEEKRDFSEFWEDALERGIRKFHTKYPNKNTTLIKRCIYSGMEVSGSVIQSGMTLDGVTIHSNQEYGVEELLYLDVKAMNPSFPFMVQRDGWWGFSWDIIQEK